MTTKAMRTCKRALLRSLRGRLVDPSQTYDKWAYWCGAERNGWRAYPCSHPFGTVHADEAPKLPMPPFFMLQQGTRSHRNPEEINWHDWDVFANRDLALKQYQELSKRSPARLLECRVLEEKKG